MLIIFVIHLFLLYNHITNHNLFGIHQALFLINCLFLYQKSIL
ncbi:hypothetical protein LDVICp151 [lymphocystis disease virus-China]|uniref:Uncharacterized protein n=1 Tax=lymphocystis disease virus-China TaxID=256729 RepID=Q677W1_9VIRU|nr:hypothetical protein LDVICp151 [lymphocystis disease virus-China]AAU10996.1 hypothetical protein [lymphocystis disease virus-China]